MVFNYRKESRDDILGPLDPLFEKRFIVLKEDGGIEVNAKINHSLPWHYVRTDPDRSCTTLRGIIFLAFKFVPSRCQECWKVVVKPKTLKELFQLEALQEGCDFYCKCGIEIRPEISTCYGGYFYFNSAEEGIAGLVKVREMVASGISPDIKVILKRGCTEMEAMFPNSSKWTVTEEQKRIEAKLFSKMSISKSPLKQTTDQLRRTRMNWVEFAWSIDDPTYYEFNDEPLYQPPDTYERQL